MSMSNPFDSKVDSPAMKPATQDTSKVISDFELLKKDLREKIKNFTPEEIKGLNKDISERFTSFTTDCLSRFKKVVSPEIFNDFCEALKKYPIIDLAAGDLKNDDGELLDLLYKGNWRDGGMYHPNQNDPYSNNIDKAGLPEPAGYTAVDKYQKATKISDNPHITQVQEDLLVYLKDTPNGSSNIFIGGFDNIISSPKDGEEDLYRAMLVLKIGDVVPVGAYVLSVNSNLEGRHQNKILKLTDVGFERVDTNGIMYTNLYKKVSE